MNDFLVAFVVVTLFGSLACTAGLIGFAVGYVWKELMDEPTPRP